jgi:hypothetical protein
MASQAVCKAQGVVVSALRTSVARPVPCKGTLAPMHSGKTQIFAPQRPMGVRSRKMTTVTAAVNGTGLPIDLRGELGSISMDLTLSMQDSALTRPMGCCRQEGFHCWRGGRPGGGRLCFSCC